MGVLGSPPAQQLSGAEETAVKVREGSAGRGFTSAPVCQGLAPSQVGRESGKHKRTDTVHQLSQSTDTGGLLAEVRAQEWCVCVCSLSMKTLCNPFTPAGLKGGPAPGVTRWPGTRAVGLIG